MPLLVLVDSQYKIQTQNSSWLQFLFSRSGMPLEIENLLSYEFSARIHKSDAHTFSSFSRLLSISVRSTVCGNLSSQKIYFSFTNCSKRFKYRQFDSTNTVVQSHQQPVELWWWSYTRIGFDRQVNLVFFSNFFRLKSA